ncbi:hypothetical protein SAMN04487770_106137 [Butyrivibrio sp. ob235]|uniref:hypothetical protein n=1 Tax=Butyrivibrio sp. ob235 TaxID=1761780 RepID=UPI0008AB7722|nr:hypothetical protein [Butyrivibrio sp. ob235]SEL15624.1 hypothetical protein SAMN04487770_106137 [Butyrivibrio sp. ob235]
MARKINVKLILELREGNMSRNMIAETRHISRHSVSDVFAIADEKGIKYADVRNLDDNAVYQMFYPDKHVVEKMFKEPDYEYIHDELKKVGVTLKLLWEEYKEKCLENGDIPMGYTRFCGGYGNFTTVNKLTNHLENKPGVKVEVTPWNDERIKNWANAIGPYTAQVINRIFTAVDIKEQYSSL